MRKLLAIGALLTLALPSFAFAATTGTTVLSPSHGTGDTVVDISFSGTATTPWLYFYTGDDHTFIGSYRHSSYSGTLNDLMTRQGNAVGPYLASAGSIIVVYNDADGVAGGVGACETSYDHCSGFGYINAQASFTYDTPPPPPPPTPVGFGLMGSSTAQGAGAALAGLTSTEVGQAFLLTVIALGVYVSFYVIEHIIVMFGARRRAEVVRRGRRRG